MARITSRRNCGHKVYLRPGRHYCSWECWKAKPQRMYEVEQAHGKPIAEIITEYRSKYTDQVAADLLGVARGSMRRWANG